MRAAFAEFEHYPVLAREIYAAFAARMRKLGNAKEALEFDQLANALRRRMRFHLRGLNVRAKPVTPNKGFEKKPK